VRWASLVMALLGAGLAIPSAIQALMLVGADPVYSTRIGMGIAALAFAFIAALSGLLALRRPGVAAILITVAMVGGAITINLFYINTLYVFAVPFWLLAAFLALIAWIARDTDSVNLSMDG
jgi:hypothetical protein